MIEVLNMGEGFRNLLPLIVNLCVADGNLFLLEEPENDIHPTALKALLELILAKAEKTNSLFRPIAISWRNTLEAVLMLDCLLFRGLLTKITYPIQRLCPSRIHPKIDCEF
jgi:AAA15 family ATPase/GTPase